MASHMDNLKEFARKKELLVGSPSEREAGFVEDVHLTVCSPEYGWMDSRLVIGSDVFPISFSQAYPPFQDMVAWLERIVAMDSSEPLEIYDEYDTHYFNAVAHEQVNDMTFEYLRFSLPPNGVYSRAFTSKNNLIKEFYYVLKFIMSIDCESEEQKEEGTSVYFSLDPYSDEIIKLDLTTIEAYLEKIDG